MVEIAMITPGFLPVPALSGGAVETLATHIIKGNEQDENTHFDIYTIPFPGLSEVKYKNSDIVEVVPSRMLHRICKVWNILMNNQTREKKIDEWQLSIVMRLKKKKYDYILVENDMLMCNLICKLFGNSNAKIIYHMHNGFDGETKTTTLIREISLRTSVILAVSNYIKNEVLKIAPEANVRVLYNAIDIDMFQKRRKDKNISRREWGIKKDDKVFVYWGRFSEEKGIKELIEAFIMLKEKEEYDDCKLMIVGKSWFGNDVLTDYVNDLKKNTKDRRDIIFTGFIMPQEVPSVLALADIAVIPSKWEEPFGLVVLEAMATGLKIVATQSGAIPEIIDCTMAEMVDKENDFVINLHNAMVKSLNDFSEDKKIKMKQRILTHSQFHARNYYDNFKKVAEI